MNKLVLIARSIQRVPASLEALTEGRKGDILPPNSAGMTELGWSIFISCEKLDALALPGPVAPQLP